MAMALSSIMAPTALGSQRRRRAPTQLAHATSWPRDDPNANASEEKETKEETMEESDARTSSRGVRFAEFDAALQHSDQTMTGSAGVGGFSAWRRRSDVGAFGFAAVPQSRARSSFFPDSTDDEESAPLAMRRSGIQNDYRRDARAPTPTPTFPVIHIGDVQFPATRTVLWDRRVLAGPFELATADVLPRVRITNRVLKQLHALVAEQTTRAASRLLGYATADESTAQNTDGSVTLSALAHEKSDAAGHRPLWSIPFHRGKPVHPVDDATDRTNMESAVRVKYEATGAASRFPTAALPVEARGFVYNSAERSHAEIDVEIDVVVPSVQLQLSLIRSLPLLMTPLATSLLRCEFGSEIRRCGFLTLDRARKAVPLLETDPLVLQRPIVGLWVYGIDIDDSSSAESIRLNHPYLVEACVRFLTSKIIKERAQVDVDTFLVAVYPGNVAGPLPRFFECRAPRTPRASSAVAWCSASARGRCLAGVSSFKNDLELSLVLTSEEDSTSASPPIQLKVPDNQYLRATTRSTAVQDSFAEYETRDAEVKRASCQVERGQPIESDSMKSCCRSQQILAAQHQQMLEHQQRQLRDLQEQIAQLQHVLTETRAENARLLLASSSRSSGSRSSSSLQMGDEMHKEEEQEDTHFHDAPTRPISAPELPADVDEQSQQGVHDGENDASMVSSLALSAVSDGSNSSDLSSVSSSVVGTRLKALLNPEHEDGGETETQDLSNASKKQAGSPREPQAVGVVDNQELSRTLKDDAAEDGTYIDDDEGEVRRTCPYVPSTKRIGRRTQCERDEFEDESDASKIEELLAERLRIPNTPNREEIVRGGALPTLGFSHGNSFSIPKIKYVAEIVTCDSDDDEEEEIQRIELKYRKGRVH